MQSMAEVGPANAKTLSDNAPGSLRMEPLEPPYAQVDLASVPLLIRGSCSECRARVAIERCAGLQSPHWMTLHSWKSRLRRAVAPSLSVEYCCPFFNFEGRSLCLWQASNCAELGK